MICLKFFLKRRNLEFRVRIEILHAVSVRLGMGQIDLFTVYDVPLGWGANMAEITVNVRDFGPLGTAVTSLQRGGFLTFAINFNSFIKIIHSAENKYIKEGATSVNSNCKSSHVASNFVVICIMFIRRVCIKS